MNKVRIIVDELRQELIAGKYASGSRFPSEHSLMQRYDTSRVTVNKVTSMLVTEKFLIRGPHGAGTYVCSGTPFPLGHFAYVGILRHPYYARILNGIQRTAFSRNYAVSVFAPEKEMINYCLECVSQGEFQGIFVSCVGKIPDTFPFPVVYVDNVATIHSEGLSLVTCDNFSGAYKMARAVLEKGHREILVYSSSSVGDYHRAQRVQGFQQALEEYGVPDCDRRIFHGNGTDVMYVKNRLKDILGQFPKTTAILTDSDDLAISVWRVLRELGLLDRVAVTGFGNVSTISGVLGFPSVEQNPEEIGTRAMEEMLKVIQHPKDFFPQVQMVETELVNAENIPAVENTAWTSAERRIQ